jgi:hypothetical protein
MVKTICKKQKKNNSHFLILRPDFKYLPFKKRFLFYNCNFQKNVRPFFIPKNVLTTMFDSLMMESLPTFKYCPSSSSATSSSSSSNRSSPLTLPPSSPPPSPSSLESSIYAASFSSYYQPEETKSMQENEEMFSDNSSASEDDDQELEDPSYKTDYSSDDSVIILSPPPIQKHLPSRCAKTKTLIYNNPANK